MPPSTAGSRSPRLRDRSRLHIVLTPPATTPAGSLSPSAGVPPHTADLLSADASGTELAGADSLHADASGPELGGTTSSADGLFRPARGADRPSTVSAGLPAGYQYIVKPWLLARVQRELATALHRIIHDTHLANNQQVL